MVVRKIKSLSLQWIEDGTLRCFLDLLFFLPNLFEGCIVVRTYQAKGATFPWIFFVDLLLHIKKKIFSNIVLERTLTQNAISIILFWMIKWLLFKFKVFLDLAVLFTFIQRNELGKKNGIRLCLLFHLLCILWWNGVTSLDVVIFLWAKGWYLSPLPSKSVLFKYKHHIVVHED